ncbi:MAG: tRNA preQ1(34) S-adenosylmethionine ribosyltransferase-isomerase QueA [Anaeromyxobacteraceae bacterium]
MKISEFDFDLPEELIAQEPAARRDASRLLVLPPEGAPEHRAFLDLPGLLAPGDLLVTNDTRVIPARLVGTKPSGGKAELLLCEQLDFGGGASLDSGPADAGPPLGMDRGTRPTLGRRWRALGQASKPIRAGTTLTFGDLEAKVLEAEGEGFFVVELSEGGAALEAALERAGRIPLPPYVRRAPTDADRERYQTVFARVPGSAAAPTAGLHFTPGALEALAARGVRRATVTLHVGPGTFLPMRGEDLDGHVMHAERYEVPEATARALAECRARGGRVVAVGTTTLRTLESAWRDGAVRAGPGRTTLFVRPGHTFRAVDALVTNFHLPRSTLLVLVCALGGKERVLAAYREAVARRYRFFSYGDAMLLLTR